MRPALVLALLLLPAASAQAILDPGPIDIERVRSSPNVFPMSQGHVLMDVRYDCRDYDAAMDDMRLEIEANATSRHGWQVPLDLSSTRTLDLDQCQWMQEAIYVDVPISFTMPAYRTQDVLYVDIAVRIASSEGAVARGPSEAVHVSTSIPMILDENASVEPVEPPQEPETYEEYAPGPGLAFLVAGLAALGTLRRR